MRSNSLHRYAMSVVAVTAATALALSATPAVSAAPAPASHAGALAYVRSAAHARSLPHRPPGAPSGLKPGAPVIVHDNAHPNGVVGYLLCLYNNQNYCVANHTPHNVAKRPSGGDVIIVVIDWIGRGVTVWTIAKGAYKAYKWVKKWTYKKQHLYQTDGDGLCMGDWAYNQDATLGSCNSAHGIWWQGQGFTHGPLWNTYAKGDLIAASTDPETDLFVHSPEDWSTWTLRPVCVNSC